MPTAVYDASYITFRNRSKALYAYNNAINAARQTNGILVAREQPNTQMAEVILTRKQGGCFCSNDAAGLSVTRQGPGACSCGR
jgi:hypothetical protein